MNSQLSGALMGDFQKQLNAKLMARQAQASTERPVSGSPPSTPCPRSGNFKAAPPPPPPRSNYSNSGPPPPPPVLAKPSGSASPPLPPPPAFLIADAEDVRFSGPTPDIAAAAHSSAGSPPVTAHELEKRNTTRYQNPGWQSNSSRSRLPILPDKSSRPGNASNLQLQFKLQLEQQLQQQRGNTKLPEEDGHSPSNNNGIPGNDELSNDYNEKFLHEITSPTAKSLERQWSKPDQGKAMYRRLHEYVHGVPIGEVLMLNEIDRAMNLELKFIAMREIFSSVGIMVDW